MSNKLTKEEFSRRLVERNIIDIILVGDYMGSDTKTTFKCLKCGYEWQVRPSKILTNESHCPNCYQKNQHNKTHEQFMQEFAEKGNKNIIILGQYINKRSYIKVQCAICGREYETLPQNLLNGCGCRKCISYQIKNHKKINYESSVAYLKPDLLKYLVNEEDAYYFTPYSKEYVSVKCPDCGAIKSIQMKSLACNGFHCVECSDHISFPNKIIRSVLNIFKDELKYIEYEWSEDWSQRMRYDVYFEIGSQKYVIEMQGGQHYYSGWGKYRNVEVIQKTDEKKYKLAIEHQIIPIIIDAKESNFDYILDNIKNSILNEIFDLSILDLKQIEKDVTSNLVKKICESYENSTYKYMKDIAKEFNISTVTLTKYIKIGAKFGWCTYKPQTRKINVYNEDYELINSYESIAECARQLSNIYEYKFNTSNIIRSCNQGYRHHNLYFQYAN